MLLMCLSIKAEDVTYTYEGQTLAYIIDDETMTCEVKGGTADDAGNDVSGALVIPAAIENGENTYTVTGIGAYAFSDCRGMTSVDLPHTIATVGSGAFINCYGLTAVNMHDIEAWCKIEFGDFSSNPTVAAHNLYMDGELITDLHIPWTVQSVGSFAFAGCSALRSVFIPSSVSYIGWTAFADCIRLESLIIPYSVTDIKPFAFMNCSGLTSVDIPSSLKSIEMYLFSGCSSLTSVDIPCSVTSIGSNAFDGCQSLTEVIIGSGVKSIGDYTFLNCGMLGKITSLASKAPVLSGNAFSEYNYQTVTLIYGDGTDVADSYADADNSWCKFLNKLGEDLSCYGELQYDYDDVLMTATVAKCPKHAPNDIVIPATVSRDGRDYTVTAIGDNAFEGSCGMASIDFPNTIRNVGREAFTGCDGLTAVNIHDLEAWCGIDFYDFSSSPTAKAHSLKLDGELLTEVVIPETVTAIGNCAFTGCNALTSVVIPNTVTDIGFSAFNGCKKLATMDIPESVTNIGSFAFMDCFGLTSVKISGPLTRISDYAFSFCVGLKSVDIPNTVTEIDNWAFSYCYNLTSVTIPEAVTTIGDGAFCSDFGLKSIYSSNLTPPYVGANNFTEEQYQSIEVYVPHDALNEYQTADTWRNFMNLKGYDNDTAIEGVRTGSMTPCGGCYDLSGRKLSEPHKGLNIINGKKVIMK